MPTIKAAFGGRIPSINLDNGSPIPLGFVLQLPSKLEEPNIGNRAGKGPVREHAGNVEVFDDDGAIARETRRELVHHIGPNVGDPPVQSCELGPSLSIPATPQSGSAR